jgi:hypothetical protein
LPPTAKCKEIFASKAFQLTDDSDVEATAFLPLNTISFKRRQDSQANVSTFLAGHSKKIKGLESKRTFWVMLGHVQPILPTEMNTCFQRNSAASSWIGLENVALNIIVCRPRPVRGMSLFRKMWRMSGTEADVGRSWHLMQCCL